MPKWAGRDGGSTTLGSVETPDNVRFKRRTLEGYTDKELPVAASPSKGGPLNPLLITEKIANVNKRVRLVRIS